MGWGKSGFNCWGLWKPALVLFLFYVNIWNAPVILLVLSTFYNTGSQGSSPQWVFYPPGSIPGDCLPFPCGE